MRKVIIPIHVKLMSFFVLILSSAIAYYVFYAVNLFESDKSAYVFESVKAQNISNEKLLLERFKNIHKTIEILSSKSTTPGLIKTLFDQNEWLLAYGQFQGRSFKKFIFDRKAQGVNKSIVTGFKKKFNSDSMSSNEGLSSIKVEAAEGHYFYKKIKKTYHLIVFDQMYLKGVFKASKLYDFMLLNSENKNVLFNSLKDYAGREGFVKATQNIMAQNGTVVIEDSLNKWITDIKKINIGGLSLLTFVREDKALEAAKFLKHKSVYVGALIVAVTIILVIFFSKILTGPIGLLFEAVQNFANKKFDSRVKLANRDEIGVLADSFNSMADEIVLYMDEMKEKERLENELKTAQLVQKSFFPHEEIISQDFHLKAFYRPASECGGDWWGILEKDALKIVILIDATGHGTPAALITAVIHNSITALEYIAKSSPEFIQNSARIMDYLNQSICNVGSDILATAFVCVINEQNKKLNYTNASHNPPLMFDAKEGVDKSSLKPLMDNNGSRLGENSSETYETTELGWSGPTKLIIYTDGLLEGENPEKKQFGNRRFTKSLINSAQAGIQSTVNDLISEAYEFYQGVEQGDDITVVGIGLSHTIKEQVTSDTKVYSDVESVFSNWEASQQWKHIMPPGMVKPNENYIETDDQLLMEIDFQSESVGEVSDKLRDELAKQDLSEQFSDLQRYIVLIGTELVQNALIASREKSQDLKVRLKFYQGSERYKILVEDELGELTYEKVMEKLKRAYITKSFEEKESGAGLGLYMVVNSCHRVVFDIDPHKSTKVCASIIKQKRLKEFKNKKISIHFV
jgi:sigma-B regulation protein RsbU (phosphoserine phosphatase)